MECRNSYQDNLCTSDNRKINVIIRNRRQQRRQPKRNRNLNNLQKLSTEPNAHTRKTKFSYINIGSVKNKTFGIYNYIHSNRLDILALTETWLFTEEEKNLIYHKEMLPPDYKITHIPRTNGRAGYGGVAIVYRDTFTLSIVNSSNDETNELHQFEFMDCKVSLNKKTVFRLLVVYRPDPTSVNKLKVKLFWKDWTRFLADVVLYHNDWIIVGDLNFHLDDQSKYHTKRFFKILNEFGLVQHIQDPTHVAKHTLDVLITPEDCSGIELPSIVVHDPCISDNDGNLAGNRHYAISWTSQHRHSQKKAKEITFQNFKSIDICKFKADLENLNLFEILSTNSDVDEMLNIFTQRITNVVSQHAPVMRKKLCSRPPSPW